MQIYPEVYKTQKCFLEKGAVVRINCIVNMLFHFWYHFFLGKSYTCFGLCKGSNKIMLNPCFAFYRLCYLGVCFKYIFVS